jgi:hypothetical protein
MYFHWASQTLLKNSRYTQPYGTRLCYKVCVQVQGAANCTHGVRQCMKCFVFFHLDGWWIARVIPPHQRAEQPTSLVHSRAPHVLLLHPGVLGVEPHGLQHSLHHVLAAVRLPARVAAVRQLLQHPARPSLDSCSVQRQAAAGMEAQHNDASKHAGTRGLRGTPSPEGAGRGSAATRWMRSMGDT